MSATRPKLYEALMPSQASVTALFTPGVVKTASGCDVARVGVLERDYDGMCDLSV